MKSNEPRMLEWVDQRRALRVAGKSRRTGLGLLLGFLLACALPAAAQPNVRFVDLNAPRGPRDGLSWQTAYRRLQNAFDDAAKGDVDRIRVAGGTYTPDLGRSVTRFDPGASFVTVDGLEVVGGFAGSAGPDPNERDIERFATVLSGDLFGNDGPDFEGFTENSFNIVTATRSVPPAILDGFTIRGGTSFGQAVQLTGGSLVLRDCAIRENAGWPVWGEESTAVFERCRFELNARLMTFNNDDWIRFSDCTFSGAHETYLRGGNFELTRCRFIDRTSGRMCIQQSRLVAIDCDFVGPRRMEISEGDYQFNGCRFLEAQREVMRVGFSFLVLAECEFAGNGESPARPAVECNSVEAEITDCSFRDNQAGAIRSDRYSNMTVSGSVFENNVNSGDYVRGGGAINSEGPLTISGGAFENNIMAGASGHGGAIHSDGPLAISECSFLGNSAQAGDTSFGGAIACTNDLILRNCDFERNHATGGGAIHIGQGSQDLFEATNCRFVRNYALGVGAIVALGIERIVLRECEFQGNAATANSEDMGYVGAIWGSAIGEFEMTDCRFIRNVAPSIGALALNGVRDLDVRRCEFIGNLADGRAGAVDAFSNRGVWRDCIFVDNHAGESGGALRLGHSWTDYQNCTFEQNSAAQGGGVYVENGATFGFLDCDFLDNQADDGAALYGVQLDRDIERCRFIGNRAQMRGGAVYLDGGAGRFGNSLLAGNEAALDGGAIWVAQDASPIFHALTIADNTAAGVAGGIGLADGSETGIDNAIFWGNQDAAGESEAAQIARQEGALLTIDYSTVQGLTGDLGGVGNSGDDPAFVDSAAGDYHLATGSPAIDAGDPDYSPAPDEMDIDGDTRIWNDRIDMGADEFRPLGDLNCDGAIDAFDIEPFVLALFDPESYASRFPDCDITLADLNRDGSVDAFDIEPFLRVLMP